MQNDVTKFKSIVKVILEATKLVFNTAKDMNVIQR